MSVVIDSNIWVSAFRFRGSPREVIQMGIDDKVDIVIAPSIIEEVVRVLDKKFRFTHEQLEAARTVMAEASRVVRPSVRLNAVPDDPNDNHVVECAVSAGAEAIVTGAKDLLRMKDYDGIRINNLSEFPKSRTTTVIRRCRFKQWLFAPPRAISILKS